jgi:tetratricopeptide (TPR) repeat protein
MPPFQPKYYPRVYRDFKEIDGADYRRIIHYYEDHEDTILRLDEYECFEMMYAYTNALFEVGYHQKHVLMSDNALAWVMEYNIREHESEDVFATLLFRKAASYYNLGNYQQAEHVLNELVRIDPYDEDVILFLKKCLRKMEPALLDHAKAASIFLFLLTAFIISVEVLFVRPFYKIYINLIETSRITTFIIACSILVFGTLWHYLRVENRVNEFVLQTRRKKK